MTSTGKYKAVIFDLGGVVVKLNEPEMVRKLVAHGWSLSVCIDQRYANSTLADGDAQSEYSKALLEFETGVISLHEFKEVVRKALGGFTPQTNVSLSVVESRSVDTTLYRQSWKTSRTEPAATTSLANLSGKWYAPNEFCSFEVLR